MLNKKILSVVLAATIMSTSVISAAASETSVSEEAAVAMTEREETSIPAEENVQADQGETVEEPSEVIEPDSPAPEDVSEESTEEPAKEEEAETEDENSADVDPAPEAEAPATAADESAKAADVQVTVSDDENLSGEETADVTEDPENIGQGESKEDPENIGQDESKEEPTEDSYSGGSGSENGEEGETVVPESAEEQIDETLIEETGRDTSKAPAPSYIYAYCNEGKANVHLYTYGCDEYGVTSCIFYRRINGGTWKEIKNVPLKDLSTDSGYYSFVDSLPDISGTYEYRCRYYAGSEAGELSEISSFMYLKKPTIKNVSANGTKVTVSWETDALASRYTIGLLNSENWWNNKNLTVGAGQTSLTADVSDLMLDEKNKADKIEVSVMAERDADAGNVQSLACTVSITVLQNPYILGSASTGARQVGLQWNTVPGATGYILYRYNAVGKTFDKIAEISNGTTLAYTDQGRTPQSKYQYKMIAFRTEGGKKSYSPGSNTVTVYTLPDKNAISTVNASVKKGKSAQRLQKTFKVNSSFSTKEGAGYVSGTRPSVISDFFDHKGYYTVAYPDYKIGYFRITRMNPKTLKPVKTIRIKLKYNSVGGVTCDSSGNYYVACGQGDLNEKGNIVTFAISKYNHKGKLLKTTTFKGKAYNIKSPFEASNCAMAFEGNNLVCSFASLGYKSRDGLSHQSSKVLAVDTRTMKKTDKYSGSMYVSHSFDQRITKLQNGALIFTHRGDGYPDRGFSISGYDEGYDFTPFHFAGAIGDNITASSLGGLESVSTGYALVGTSVKSLKTLKGNEQVFIQFTNPNSMTASIRGSSRKNTVGDTVVKDDGILWLTNYKGDNYASSPHVVKMDNDRLLIVWEKVNWKKIGVTSYYAIVSANGKILQKPTKIGNIELNENEELKYKDGCIYWSTSDYESEVTVNKVKINAKLVDVPSKVALKKAVARKSGNKITWKKAKKANKYYIFRKTGRNGKWKKIGTTKRTFFLDKKAKKTKQYYYTVKGINTKSKQISEYDHYGVTTK